MNAKIFTIALILLQSFNSVFSSTRKALLRFRPPTRQLLLEVLKDRPGNTGLVENILRGTKNLSGIYVYCLQSGSMSVSGVSGEVAIEVSPQMTSNFLLVVTTELEPVGGKNGALSWRIPSTAKVEAYHYIKEKGTGSSGKKGKKPKTWTWKVERRSVAPGSVLEDLATLVVVFDPDKMLVLEGAFKTQRGGMIVLFPENIFILQNNPLSTGKGVTKLGRYFRSSVTRRVKVEATSKGSAGSGGSSGAQRASGGGWESGGISASYGESQRAQTNGEDEEYGRYSSAGGGGYGGF